jgi:uncharacterized membrane protein
MEKEVETPIDNCLREDRLTFLKVRLQCLRASELLEGFDKRTIQTFGFALIILGILLIMVCLLSIIAFMESTYCPASGCPPYSLPAQSLLLPTFFSGIALVIMGIILLIIARGKKSKRESDADDTH